MRQIRCRLYKGINTKEPDASLRFGAAQSKSAGRGPPATPPAGTETRTQHRPHGAGAEGGGLGAHPSRLGMGDPLSVHRAPQQLLHVPRHVDAVIQVKVTLGVHHGVGVLRVHVVMGLGADGG